MGEAKKNKTKNLGIYLLSFAASAVGIGLNFFLARVLEAENYGKIQYLVALATTCSQFMLFGLSSFLIREAKNENQRGEAVNKCFSLYLAIVLFFAPIIFFVLNGYIDITANNLIISLSVLVVAILMGLNSLIAAYNQGNGKYHLSLIFENLLPKLLLLVTAIIFMVIAKLNTFQENYLIFYIIFYSAISIPFLLIVFKRINFKLSKAELKSIFFFFGVTITYSLGNNLTKVLQGGLYKNDVALGIISVSINILSLIAVFTSVLDNLVKPIFAKKKRENDIDGLLDIYRFDTRMNSYIAIPMYLFFALHPTMFLGIFGESYLLYPGILTIIVAAHAISGITGPNGTLLAMTGKEKYELFNGILFFACYVGFVFVFSFDKIYGLSYSLLVSQFVVNVAKYVEVWVIYKKTPLNLKTLLSLLIVIVVNFAAIFALTYVKIGMWYWLGIGILVGIALVLCNTFILTLYRKNDFKQLLNLKL